MQNLFTNISLEEALTILLVVVAAMVVVLIIDFTLENKKDKENPFNF